MTLFIKELFLKAVETVNKYPLNEQQEEAVLYDHKKPLFLVAGPGTGKTTVLTFRILKFIFMDGITPNRIIATTFTVKAANELRSRILENGYRMKSYFLNLDILSEEKKKFLNIVDFNQIKTGTLDSIAEEILTEYRNLDELPPVIIDDLVAKGLLINQSIFKLKAYKNKKLLNYIKKKYNLTPMNTAKLRDFIQRIYEKTVQDQIDFNKYIEDITDSDEKENVIEIKNLIDTYKKYVWYDKNLYDFSRLEFKFFKKLKSEELNQFIKEFDILLVDEYQDTNYLQQEIYFNIIKKIKKRYEKKSGIKNSIFCPLTVVGDDDQSLYRFRGSTVQLFRDFRRNFQTLFNIEPKLLFLVTNYRSSESIISFYNYFLKLDPNYLKNARVNEKEFVENKDYSESPSNFPVLGMFRDDLKTLAKDLSEFINEVFHGSGRYIEDNPIKYRLKANPNGDIGDCVLLMASPREFSSWRKIRLPAYLREFFRDKGVSVFNPRGEEISSILNFQRLTGLILICIDNDRRIQKGLHLYKNLDDTFDKWRKKAEDYIENLDDKNLNNYIKSWNNRNSSKNESWEIPLLDVVYDIIHWFGEFQDNPQDQLYLELLTRTISESSTFSRYESRIVKLEEKTDLDSIKEIYWNIFVPIASGEIYLNEDLIEDFPHNQFNILSIHQSKGLEFPIVIVDVGSEFERENQKQAFKRFPNREDLGLTYILEQEFRNYTPIDGFLENREDPVERAFDDLIRKFYVGYSRAQEVLLLVGLTSNIKKKIPNIPLGWNREKEWFWENLDKILLMI